VIPDIEDIVVVVVVIDIVFAGLNCAVAFIATFPFEVPRIQEYYSIEPPSKIGA